MNSASAPPARRGVMLAALIGAYALNFVDRQAITILKEPIAAELHLTDAQLGLMGGLAFASLYTLLGIPAAWAADRFNRSWIMTAALTLWSGFTLACGLAGNFAQLFAARMGVGFGEAGGVAPAYSLICDAFSRKQRGRALGLYALGVPIGSAAGVLFGGLLAKAYGWRIALFVLGAAGLLFAPLFRWCVREWPRGGQDGPASPPAPAPSLGDVIRLAAGKPSFWLLSLGAASASTVGYGLLYWLPTFLLRSLHLDIASRSAFMSALVLIGGVIGMTGGGVLADRLGPQKPGAYAVIPAIAFLGSGVLWALGMLAATPLAAFLMFLAPQALGLAWFGPITTAVQHLGPPAARATLSSLFLFIVNLLGLALGTYVFGALSDALKPALGAESLRAAFLIGLSFYGLAALLLLLAARRLRGDWVEGPDA